MRMRSADPEARARRTSPTNASTSATRTRLLVIYARAETVGIASFDPAPMPELEHEECPERLTVIAASGHVLGDQALTRGRLEDPLVSDSGRRARPVTLRSTIP